MNSPFISTIIKQKKIYVLYFIIFLCYFVSTTIIIQANYFIGNHMIPKIENKYQNREIFIASPKNINYVESSSIINKIHEIELSQLYMNYKTVYIGDIDNNTILLDSGLLNHGPSILYGKYIDPKNSNEIVLPNYLVIGSKKESTLKFLNNEIVINFLDEDKNAKSLIVKVVGIYDINKNSGFDRAYISPKNVINFNGNNPLEYIAIINKTDNVKNVIDKLENLGFDSNLFDDSLQNELEVYTSLSKILKTFFDITTILCISIICFLTKDLINMNIDTIAIMKAVGYKESTIIKNLFSIIVIISTTSYLISTILILAVLIFCNMIIDVHLTINVGVLLFIYLIYLVGAIIIEFLFLIRIKKISIINLLNSK